MQKSTVPGTPDERRQWLKDDANRATVLGGGAGILFHFGDTSDPENLFIVISHRAGKSGDGLGFFGGLREDEDIVPGNIVLTQKNNARREAAEEMEEILGYEPDLSGTALTTLYTARDDAWFIKNGSGFAVDSTFHACPIPDDLREALFPGNTRERQRSESSSAVETGKIEIASLASLLSRAEDFHYPHEYFALWVAATRVFKFDMTPHLSKVDFQSLAQRMDVRIADLERIVGLSFSATPASARITARAS